MLAKLETEVSRVDCRLYDEGDNLKHYFTLDRVNKDTVMLVGVTFPISKDLLLKVVTLVKLYDFKFISFERPNRTVTYDIINSSFVKIEK